jgi:hypothetical protein
MDLQVYSKKVVPPVANRRSNPASCIWKRWFDTQFPPSLQPEFAMLFAIKSGEPGVK